MNPWVKFILQILKSSEELYQDIRTSSTQYKSWLWSDIIDDVEDILGLKMLDPPQKSIPCKKCPSRDINGECSAQCIHEESQYQSTLQTGQSVVCGRCSCHKEASNLNEYYNPDTEPDVVE